MKWLDQIRTVIEGEDGDTVEFGRRGVNGTLEVRADSFELNAKLGFLLGAFARTIETEIESNLDELLSEGTAAASKKVAPKATARKRS